MAWIDIIDEQDASGELADVYASLQGGRGKVANIMKVQSLNPKTMRTHMDLYMSVMFGRSGLKREERELIAVIVSALNGCDYCINHHAEALEHYWHDRDRIDRVVEDYRNAELPERALALLDYASKLTRTPQEMNEADLAALRDVGLSDKDILDTNLIIGYFNFVNRIATGLGVTFSLEEVAGYKY